ncbi:MAG: ribosome small subunit-dependent GTPase A [Clostridiales bacterium]|jgi:ribosome biogenesis GTPase|nr:ribosome small subunit-dependent GTPase A [Clostridiales bacterium]
MIDGRLIKGIGGLYSVATPRGTYTCGARGVFRIKDTTPLIGDYVSVEIIDETQRAGRIARIKPRRSELARPRVANIDCAVIVFSIVEPPINLELLDRLLLLTAEQDLRAVICINKTDLLPHGGSALSDITAVYAGAGYEVLCVSAAEGSGIEELRRAVSRPADNPGAGATSVLAGPSGVGKSSIVNKILRRDKMEIGGLSLKIGRGKHTTRHAELIEIYENDGRASGSYIVDSPGFTSLDISHIPHEKLARLVKEFGGFEGMCRFKDCRHLSEPGCAVRAEVGRAIDAGRYERYVNMVPTAFGR